MLRRQWLPLLLLLLLLLPLLLLPLLLLLPSMVVGRRACADVLAEKVERDGGRAGRALDRREHDRGAVNVRWEAVCKKGHGLRLGLLRVDACGRRGR